MNSVGSVWQKWDLHIHTPASFHWNGKKLGECLAPEKDQICQDIVARLNTLDICGFCIMDYWTFDGFLMLREFLLRNPNATKKVVFPGIELRMAAPTNHSRAIASSSP
jgi:hypothetical protein